MNLSELFSKQSQVGSGYRGYLLPGGAGAGSALHLDHRDVEDPETLKDPEDPFGYPGTRNVSSHENPGFETIGLDAAKYPDLDGGLSN